MKSTLSMQFVLLVLLVLVSFAMSASLEGFSSNVNSRGVDMAGRDCPTGYVKQEMGCELTKASVTMAAPVRQAKCYGKYKLTGRKCKCTSCAVKQKNACTKGKKFVRGFCAGPCPDGYWLIFVPEEKVTRKALTCEQPDIVDPECIAGERRIMDRCYPESTARNIEQSTVITRSVDE